MHFEELQQHWQRLEEKLDRTFALEAELVRHVVMQPARRRIHRLAIWPVIDIALAAGVLLLSGLFLSSHWRDSTHLVPVVIVILAATGLLISSVRQLQYVFQLDWSGPVASIQRSLEQLRGEKIQQFKWVILFSPLVGFCGLMMCLHWLADAGVNILAKLDPWWIMGNYLFGLLFVPVGYHIARFLAQRCQQYPWWQAVLDDISGNSLKKAAQNVERWASLQGDGAQ